MYVAVDNTDTRDKVEGFIYTNKSGHLEGVSIDGTVINIGNFDDKIVTSYAIYTTDIPLLIKALQAAEDHLKRGNN